MKRALLTQIARGEYVVEAHAVAEAMLRRGWRPGESSSVLVPAQGVPGSTRAVGEREVAASGGDTA